MNNDIRLPEYPFEFNGKTYMLRCNFNVLADVVEECGGKMPDIFNEASTLKNVRLFLAAMINDYADEMGWDEHFTPKQIGRKISLTDGTLMREVMNLVIRANYQTAEDSGSDSKN